MMGKVSLFILLITLFISCGFRKESNDQINSDQIYLSISKTGCFGNCPIYTLSLNRKTWSLNGYKFFKFIGEFETDAIKSEIDEIIAQSRTLAWADYKSRYLSGYSDLPSTVLQYSSIEGDTTTITYENNLAPKELVELVDYLDSKIDSKEWAEIDR
jgi:hypothetical protein